MTSSSTGLFPLKLALKVSWTVAGLSTISWSASVASASWAVLTFPCVWLAFSLCPCDLQVRQVFLVTAHEWWNVLFPSLLSLGNFWEAIKRGGGGGDSKVQVFLQKSFSSTLYLPRSGPLLFAKTCIINYHYLISDSALLSWSEEIDIEENVFYSESIRILLKTQ